MVGLWVLDIVLRVVLRYPRVLSRVPLAVWHLAKGFLSVHVRGACWASCLSMVEFHSYSYIVGYGSFPLFLNSEHAVISIKRPKQLFCYCEPFVREPRCANILQRPCGAVARCPHHARSEPSSNVGWWEFVRPQRISSLRWTWREEWQLFFFKHIFKEIAWLGR